MEKTGKREGGGAGCHLTLVSSTPRGLSSTLVELFRVLTYSAGLPGRPVSWTRETGGRELSSSQLTPRCVSLPPGAPAGL